MKRAGQWGLVGLLAAVATTPGAAAPEERVAVDGYLQARMIVTERPSGVYGIEGSTFTVRRARVRFRYAAGLGRVVIQLDGAASADPIIRDAYVQIPFGGGEGRGPFTFWAGQFVVPFGYAMLSSSSRNLFPERPVGFEADAVGLALFTNLRDRGLRLTYDMGRTQADVAVVNGSGLVTADPNRSKDIVLRLSRTFGTVGAVASARIGNQPISGVDRQRSIWGLGARVAPSFGGEATAEFATGRDAANAISQTTPRLWYVQYTRPLGPRWYAGARYTSFDPDIDNVGVAGNTGEERGPAFVLAYQMDEHLRLTWAVEVPSVTTGLGRETATAGIFQTQYAF